MERQLRPWQYQLTGAAGPSTEFRELPVVWRTRHSHGLLEQRRPAPLRRLPSRGETRSTWCSRAMPTGFPTILKELGHDRVATLPFAAQPAVHNPVRPRRGWHARGVAFAGMYFAHKYPERRAQMEMLLGAASAEADAGGAGSWRSYSRQLGGDEKLPVPGAVGLARCRFTELLPDANGVPGAQGLPQRQLRH